MSTFYAQYPATGVSTVTVQTVQGEGTPGVQTGGVLTVQGDPSGTPIPVSGIVTTINPSVGITGSAVPADATYLGINSGGNLIGLTGSATGANIVANASTSITWQAEGNLAFGSITNAFQTIFTPAANTKFLFMRNNTNASISVSMDAGTTTNFIFDSGDQLAVDFVANGVISTTTAIQIKYTSGAPTSGSFRVNGGH